MKKGKLLGVKIKINPWLLVMLISSFFWGAPLELLIVFLVVLIHELSHCGMAVLLAVPVEEIQLFPFGGVVKTPLGLETAPLKETLIALAGPASNFIMLGIGYFFMILFPQKTGWGGSFLSSNWAIGIFNLLPILPLDGGRVLRALLTYRYGIKQGTMIAILLGKVLTLGILILGVVLTINSWKNVYILFLSIFLYTTLCQERKTVFFLYFKEVLGKKRRLHERGIMSSRYLTVLETVELNRVFQEFSAGKYHFISVLSREGKILGVLTETEVLEALGHHTNPRTIGDLVHITKNIEESS